jgi:hypothetical protein
MTAYMIAKISNTDYPASVDKQSLQDLAKELNADAFDSDEPDRWIVIDEQDYPVRS